MKNRKWFTSGRRFHISLRQTLGKTGPSGIGFRLFFWRPHGWLLNVDLLLGPWDLQIGIHEAKW